MKFASLIKYSLYLLIMILLTFFILTVYIYFFSNNVKIEMIYGFLIPVSLFITSMLFGRSTKEKGLIVGLEMWIVYFALVCLLKLILKTSTEISIITHLIFLPISILGGITGVNKKK